MSLHAVSYKWLAIKQRVKGYRLADRFDRLWQHLGHFRKNKSHDVSATRFIGQPGSYLIDLFFFVLDIFAFGEIYETISEWVKFNTRALNQTERGIVQEIFGATVDVDRIRIDEFAIIPKFMNIAYVGVYTINHFGKMSEDLFVHELIHIYSGAKYLLNNSSFCLIKCSSIKFYPFRNSLINFSKGKNVKHKEK